MKRFFAIFLLLFSSLFILNPLCALAASADAPLFQTEITDTAKKAGDTFSVTLSPKRDVAAFIMDLQYDAAVITEVRAELTGTAKKDFLTFSDENGTAVLAYTAAKDTMTESGGIEFHFRTDSEADVTASDVRFQITDAADSSAKSLLKDAEIHTVSLELPSPPSEECALLSLTPPAGTLSPEFDPAVTEYTLEVPFAYTMLTFDATPVDGASVKVNRKNLGAGGSTVDFRFTVTAADGMTKTIYTVAVTRLAKETVVSADDGEATNVNTDKAAQSSAAPTLKPSAADTNKNGKNNDKTTDTATENAAVTTDAVTDETTEPVTYIYPQTQTNLWADRLITAAIVLVSVCAGAGITLLLQAHAKPKNNENKNKAD